MSLLRCVLLVLASTLFFAGPIWAQVPGDIDGDGAITIEDVDFICSAISSASSEPTGDINGDGSVEFADLEQVLESIGSRQGDLNLDGLVQFRDFVKLASNFGKGFEDENEVATWSEGDFDCEGSVDFADFLYLISNYGEFQVGAEVAETVASVPEPSGVMIATFLAACLLGVRSRDEPSKSAGAAKGAE